MSINETSVLMFSSKSEIEQKNEISDPGNARAPHKVTIETRDAVLKTDMTPLIKFKIIKGEGEQLNDAIWLDYRSSEVQDFLDVINGRKHQLRASEHVETIAKHLSVDLKILDEDNNKLSDKIKESIVINIYNL